MPTKFTNTAGGFAYASAALWVAAAGLFALGDRITADWDLPIYLVWAALITLGGACLIVAAVGIRETASTRRGWALGGIVIVGVGVAVGVLATWAIPLWMAIQGLGLLILVAVSRPLTRASAALGLGMPLGVAIFVALTALEVGTPDQYGDFPAAWQTGLAVGLLTVAAGLIGVGRQLRSTDFAPSISQPVQA